MAYNTIKVKQFADIYNEAKAASIITPGDLVELDSSGDIQRNTSDKDLNAEKCFALENAWEGKEISVDYAIGDRVVYMVARAGDEVYAIIEDGQTIAIGDKLVSAGDGALEEYADAGKHIATALEAVSPSGSDGRCLVRVA